MPDSVVDRKNCIPVMPNGECPNCGWKWNSPEWTEPHPVLPYGRPKVEIKSVCANCGVAWNLDAVKCSSCAFEPKGAEVYDKLLADKNALRKAQFLPPLPVRVQVITTTADTHE